MNASGTASISDAPNPPSTRFSFGAFRERYLRNFTGWNVPKAERAESLTLDVTLSPAEAFFGCTIPVGVPAFGACPECGGTGRVFLFPCLDCAGSGLLEAQRTLHVRVPPRVQPGVVLEVPLGIFGIRNLYLRVQISISGSR